jgi:hypothetical protein
MSAPVLAFTNSRPERERQTPNRRKLSAVALKADRLFRADPAVGRIVEKLIDDLLQGCEHYGEEA